MKRAVDASSREPRIESIPETIRLLNRLLGQSSVGMVALNPRHCILSLNSKAEDLLGLRKPEALGVLLEKCFAKAARTELRTFLLELDKTDQPQRQVLERVSLEGQPIVIELNAELLFEDNVRYTLLILQDETSNYSNEGSTQQA